MCKKSEYKLRPAEDVVIFEVYLPKRMHYASKMAEVLDSFLDSKNLRRIPIIEDIIKKEEAQNPFFDADSFIELIQEVVTGYSIYEVDGRSSSPAGLIDERVWVIRFIVKDHRGGGSVTKELDERASNVMRLLIAERFAEELNAEDEIWFIRYEGCSLQRWVRDK